MNWILLISTNLMTWDCQLSKVESWQDLISLLMSFLSVGFYCQKVCMLAIIRSRTSFHILDALVICCWRWSLISPPLLKECSNSSWRWGFNFCHEKKKCFCIWNWFLIAVISVGTKCTKAEQRLFYLEKNTSKYGLPCYFPRFFQTNFV